MSAFGGESEVMMPAFPIGFGAGVRNQARRNASRVVRSVCDPTRTSLSGTTLWQDVVSRAFMLPSKGAIGQEPRWQVAA